MTQQWNEWTNEWQQKKSLWAKYLRKTAYTPHGEQLNSSSSPTSHPTNRPAKRGIKELKNMEIEQNCGDVSMFSILILLLSFPFSFQWLLCVCVCFWECPSSSMSALLPVEYISMYVWLGVGICVPVCFTVALYVCLAVYTCKQNLLHTRTFNVMFLNTNHGRAKLRETIGIYTLALIQTLSLPLFCLVVLSSDLCMLFYIIHLIGKISCCWYLQNSCCLHCYNNNFGSEMLAKKTI